LDFADCFCASNLAPAPEAREFSRPPAALCHSELRQTRRCYDLSPARLFSLAIAATD
jgi:hypothetical protein